MNALAEISRGLPAVAQSDARVLILGSLPGQESLRRREYYANPRNAFWPIMGVLFGAAPELLYQARLDRLKQSRIALWDVCASACRPGSLDAKISLEVANDFGQFFRRHQEIELVCFNGATAARIYRCSVLGNLAPACAQIRREQLPSTAPSYAAVRFEQKLNRWREVLYSVLRDS